MASFKKEFKSIQQQIDENNLNLEAREAFFKSHDLPLQLSIFDMFSKTAVAKAVNDTINAVNYFHAPAITNDNLHYTFDGRNTFINTIRKLYSNSSFSDDDILSLLDFRGVGGIYKSIIDKEESIKNMIPADHFRSLLRSINTSYFTPPELISQIWSMLKKLGLPDHALLLDPCFGSGAFTTYMPAEMHSNCTVIGVERDPFTAKLAETIQPNVDLYKTSLEYADFEDKSGQFDAVVSNIPFGDIDADTLDYGRVRIHNYFFRRAMDEVRNGGFVAFVVSRFFMDSKKSDIREALSKQGKLVAAYRLPNSVFGDYASTDTATDLVIIQKSSDIECGDWVNTDLLTLDDKEVRLNQYFIDNPEHILGDVSISLYQNRWHTLGDMAETANQLNQLSSQLTPIYFCGEVVKKPSFREFIPDTDQLSKGYDIGEVFKINGDIYIKGASSVNQNGESIPTIKALKVNKQSLGRLKLYCDIKSALVELLDAEKSDLDEMTINDLRLKLSDLVSAFHHSYGALNRPFNKRTYKLCSKHYKVTALEVDYSQGISATAAKKQNIATNPETFKLAKILSKRVLKPYQKAKFIKCAKEAYLTSFYELGFVDIDHIANLCGLTVKSTLNELDGFIFLNPVTGIYETKDQYLSGNVIEKLEQANQANTNNKYDRNIHYLEKVKPSPLEFEQIIIPLGAGWVPESIYKAFFTHAMETKIEYAHALGKHHISGKADALNRFGTNQVNAAVILEKALNSKPVIVKTELHDNGNIVKVIDHSASFAANNKVDELKTEWKNWLAGNVSAQETLTGLYNKKFNVIANTNSDINWLKNSANCTMSPRDHQIRIAQRGITARTLMIDAAVGSGKTLISAMIAIEKKRLFNTRTMLVAPNHTVPQLGNEIQHAYPGADILTLSTDDLSADNRRATLHRIAQYDFDLCIIPTSSFKLIPLDYENQKVFIERERAILEDALENLDSGYFSIKNIEKKLEKLEQKESQLLNKAKDYSVCFEDLSIQTLIVDEAHMFKNLAYHTNFTDIGGLGNPTGSDAAFDLFSKSQYLLAQSKHNAVIFMTGTPIMNSVSELFTWFKYLNFTALDEMGLTHFDDFSGVFCQPTTDYEIAPSGRGFKLKTRIKTFTNVPELQAMYFNFSEVVTAEELTQYLPKINGKPAIPPLKGNTPTRVLIEPCEAQDRIFDEIGEQAKDLTKHNTNMLELMYRGRMASIDPRIVDPNADFNENGKLPTLAKNVFDKACDFEMQKGTQIIFCDSSVSNQHKSKALTRISELEARSAEGDLTATAELASYSQDYIHNLKNGFSAYDEIKRLLIQFGMKESEIAFIQDYSTPMKKNELRKLMNSGEIKVLLASTALGGSGLNVNKRLVAIHHVDIPYRCGDITQRNGRILRQGNEIYLNALDSFEIEIFYYGVKRTLDAWFYSLNEQKANMITSFRTSDIYNRSIQESEADDITYSELKAHLSENPLLLKQVKLTAQVKKLEAVMLSEQSQVFRSKNTIAHSKRQLTNAKTNLEKVNSLLETVSEQVNKPFSINIEGKTYHEMGKLKKKIDTKHTGKGLDALHSAIKKNLFANTGHKLIGEYSGLDIYHVFDSHTSYLSFINQSGHEIHLEINMNLAKTFEAIVDIPDMISNSKSRTLGRIAEYSTLIKTNQEFLDKHQKSDTQALDAAKAELNRVNVLISESTNDTAIAA